MELSSCRLSYGNLRVCDVFSNDCKKGGPEFDCILLFVYFAIICETYFDYSFFNSGNRVPLPTSKGMYSFLLNFPHFPFIDCNKT